MLKFLIDSVDLLLPLFDMTFKSAKKTASEFPRAEKYNDYVKNVVLQLLKA